MISFTGVGVLATYRLIRTERLWREWAALLLYLYTDLRYTAKPVQTILAALDKEAYPSLGWLAEFNGERQGVLCPRGLCVQEKTFASAFFAFIGTSDLEGQLAHIAQYTDRAQEQLRQASERRGRLSRVYTSTAVCMGISTAIMML